MESAQPGSERELQRLIAEAARAEMPVEIIGAGTKRTVGRPVNSGMVISTSDLKGVTLYEPTELVMGAKTGTPLADIEQRLAENGQMLAFEPIDLGPVLGRPANSGTGVRICDSSDQMPAMLHRARGDRHRRGPLFAPAQRSGNGRIAQSPQDQGAIP